ncbi:MAG: penicillin acylase family protein [Dehalococcoidia bacterium]
MEPRDCLAVQDGEIEVSGLEGTLTITRDRWGIPHIRAGSAHDAFFGQGFCMAQERAWQIEMIRQMAHGRAAALLNRGLLNLDKQARRQGYGRLAAAEVGHQTPEAREALEAYAAGINAAIDTQPTPFELRSVEREMAPWSPVDSLAIIKLVNDGMQWAAKLRLAMVAEALGPEAVEALVPAVPKGSALIVPAGASWSGEEHPFKVDPALAQGEPEGPIPSGGGSNCWVIHGSRTVTGKPYVAGDPHLRLILPGQWFVVHMECPEFTAAGPCNPGYPGPVFYGHNTHVAWTMTHAQGDRWDLYRERIRQGPNGPEALYRGAWEALRTIDETYEIRDEEPETERIWLTRHGPVIFGEPLKDEEVVAARWGLAEPAHDMDAMVSVLRSRNAAEAREGFRKYDSVSGNYCFADTSGDIGYQYAGRIPRRPARLTPVPGWDGEHEWDGSVPKEELPVEQNPEAGYLLTANNKTTTPDYPHYLTYVATPFRAGRLRELINSKNKFTLDDLREMQADQTSIPARELAGEFAAVPVQGKGARLQEILRGWDGHMAAGEAAPLVFDRVCEALVRKTVRARYSQVKGAPPMLLMEERRLIHAERGRDSSPILPAGTTWAEAVATALEAAAAELESDYGPDPASWRWDSRHVLTWRHNLGRDGDLAPLLNIPPVPVGGDGNTPFNASYEHDGRVSAGVSYRQLFDLADLNAARICVPPGNSGQPGSPHYADNVERWRNVEYHPLFVDWDDIEANTEAHLRLDPEPPE